MSEFEDRLRETLARHADEAPAGRLLAEQIVRDVPAAQPDAAPRRVRTWRAWTFPLIAAGAVGAVVAAIVGIENYHPSASSPAGTHSVVNPASTAAHAVHSPSAPATTTAPVDTSTLHNIRVLDLTFVGPDDGWALASADCVRGTGRCTAFLRTTDGRQWRSMPGPAFNVEDVKNCADPCVQNMRFANDSIGYAFGPSALFMTTDGGLHWKRQNGMGADALETLSGNVILARIADQINLSIWRAPIGSMGWQRVTMPGAVYAEEVTLVRTGHDAFVMTSRGPAGSLYEVAIYTSTNDGMTWTKRADPCRSVGAVSAEMPLAASEMTTAADGSLSLLCGTGGGTAVKQVVVTSPNAGVSFAAGPPFALGASGMVGELATPTGIVALVNAGDGVYRSTNGGRTWHRVIRDGTNGGGICGFESTKVGRCVSNDRRTIWTTRDAGQTWQSTVLG